MPLENDILQEIDAAFPASDREQAIQELCLSGKSGRIARCIVLAANGSLSRLRELLQLAEIDFRDVIVAGEYDAALNHIRDLRASFRVRLPEDTWVGEVVVLLAKFGYELTQLKSRPATAAMPRYNSGLWEGVATFSGGSQSIKIVKRSGRWTIVSPAHDRRKFGLDAAIEDEERFRIQLNWYLSEMTARNK